jgi:hypothetical protein
MVALCKSVIPAEYTANLDRFDCLALSELLAYLMYGDGDDQGPKEEAEEPAKKK